MSAPARIQHRDPEAFELERAALLEDRPLTPTVEAVATALEQLLNVLDAGGPLAEDPAGPVAHALWDFYARGDRGSYRTNPVAVCVRTRLPRKYPELTGWDVAVYGYRLVVSWQAVATGERGSLGMLMPYGVNLFLEQFNAGGHRRLVARRHWWSRSPRHPSGPSTTARTVWRDPLDRPPPPPRTPAPPVPPEPPAPPAPPVARRGPPVVRPDQSNRSTRRRRRPRPRPQPAPGQLSVDLACGCQVVYGRHGYDPTDPDQQPERLIPCEQHQASAVSMQGRP